MAAAGVIDAFPLPTHLEAAEPPEARGLKRDDVRLLVSHIRGRHDCPFPVLRVAAVARARGRPGRQHERNTQGSAVGTHEEATGSSCTSPHACPEISGRSRCGARALTPRSPIAHARAGTSFELEDGGRITILAPYPLVDTMEAQSRLWIAALQFDEPVFSYLERFGSPIRYSYVRGSWPESMYQTVFATEPGSAEMPSAGRPFTAELVTRLISLGVQIAPAVVAHRCRESGRSRAALRGVLSRHARNGRAHQRREALRPSCGRGRYDSRSRARDCHRQSGNYLSGGGLDEPRDYSRTASTHGDRIDHRLSRTARHASRDRPSGHRRGWWRRTGLAPRARL